MLPLFLLFTPTLQHAKHSNTPIPPTRILCNRVSITGGYIYVSSPSILQHLLHININSPNTPIPPTLQHSNTPIPPTRILCNRVSNTPSYIYVSSSSILQHFAS